MTILDFKNAAKKWRRGISWKQTSKTVCRMSGDIREMTILTFESGAN